VGGIQSREEDERRSKSNENDRPRLKVTGDLTINWVQYEKGAVSDSSFFMFCNIKGF
jgi:hypothetical protein